MNQEIIKYLKSIDYQNILTEYFIEKVLDKGISKIHGMFKTHAEGIEKKVKKFLTTEDYEKFISSYELSVSEDILFNHINSNINAALMWSKDINFNLAKRSRELEKVFVDIDLYLSPLKNRFDSNEIIETTKSSRVNQFLDKNILVYGGPGAGKTTLMKNICKSFINGKINNNFSCPIVIRFRELDHYHSYKEYGNDYNLYRILLQTFGITIDYPQKQIEKAHNEYHLLMKQTVLEFLEQSRVLLIFDGFDEIPYPELKQVIENDFENLSLSMKESKFILTSRSGDFKIKLSNTHTFEICPLNDAQILNITRKWLNSKKEADDLFYKIKTSPYYDTTLRPLTLSHLCAIYERRKSIPPKPRFIYDLVIQLLLEKWDEERGVIRPSAYADFYIEKKKEFLAHLSFLFSFELKTTLFTSDDIRWCYNQIYKRHGLPASQAKKVVNEIESHSGILIQNGFDCYQFSHKSLQEYLTAKYLFSLPSIPEIKYISILPNEFAIAVSLSGAPNAYFLTLLNKRKDFKTDFWNIFLDRLLDERPDFNEDSIVLVFFIIMIYESDLDIFTQSLFELIEKTNLKISVPHFLDNYIKGREYQGHVTYEHKNLKTPIDKRNYMPGHLTVISRLHELIIAKK